MVLPRQRANGDAIGELVAGRGPHAVAVNKTCILALPAIIAKDDEAGIGGQVGDGDAAEVLRGARRRRRHVVRRAPRVGQAVARSAALLAGACGAGVAVARAAEHLVRADVTAIGFLFLAGACLALVALHAGEFLDVAASGGVGVGGVGADGAGADEDLEGRCEGEEEEEGGGYRCAQIALGWHGCCGWSRSLCGPVVAQIDFSARTRREDGRIIGYVMYSSDWQADPVCRPSVDIMRRRDSMFKTAYTPIMEVGGAEKHL